MVALEAAANPAEGFVRMAARMRSHSMASIASGIRIAATTTLKLAIFSAR